MAFLNTIRQQLNPKGQPNQTRTQAPVEHKQATEKELRASDRLTPDDLLARPGSPAEAHSLLMHKPGELNVAAAIEGRLVQCELAEARLKLIVEKPRLTTPARLPSPSQQPDPSPETARTQPQGEISVKSILSAPWSTEPTAETTIATHLDALHRAAAHAATREATSKAMKFLLGHARDSRDSTSCPPCMIMREILEQHQSERMRPFRQATAGFATLPSEPS